MKKPSRKNSGRREDPKRGPTRFDRGSNKAEQRHPSRPRPRFPREVSVLYEDDAVIVLDKPAGLLSVPIKGSNVPSAFSLLTENLKSKKQRVFVVHRIDRFASGILLFAKTNRDRDVLVRQFLDHTPVRQYLAVIRGRIKQPSGTLVHYFRREGMYQQVRTERDPKATRAELRFRVERLFADASLIRVDLVTGLQNQIRAQFAAVGHPLIGDRKYHPAESSEQLIDRVALHAAYLAFFHPRSGEQVSAGCKTPPDFQHLVRELSRTERMR